MELRKINRKGQMSLSDAPNIVLIVGIVFLVMATIAFIGQKYGQAIPSSKTVTSVNETVTQANLITGTYWLENASLCNSESITAIQVTNSTEGPVISAGNYTLDANTGVIVNLTNTYSTSNWLVTYSTSYAGVACTVNQDLETNISDNTSIAGIILTISLVGIVLTILIGVFVGVRRTRV